VSPFFFWGTSMVAMKVRQAAHEFQYTHHLLGPPMVKQFLADKLGRRVLLRSSSPGTVWNTAQPSLLVSSAQAAGSVATL
jgi:hypothetical protein